jgi:predicted alpha/beta superfamily hydrolase
MGGLADVRDIPGTLVRHAKFKSKFVEARHVDVWLPEGYSPDGEREYNVVYLHDGQNLFDPTKAFAGVDWGIHQTMARLLDDGEIRKSIAVGIWNTPKRLLRYMPERPYELIRHSEAAEIFSELNGGQAPASDRYVDFIVTELKPFIESRYRVKETADGNLIMGASMGGLVSLYAVCEYPTVFGGAGCLSTSWTIAGDPFIRYLENVLPRPENHKFYFDYGQEALIDGYVDYQRQATAHGLGIGYRKDKNWMVRSFPDHDHSERSWRERVSIPLRFLLG